MTLLLFQIIQELKKYMPKSKRPIKPARDHGLNVPVRVWVFPDMSSLHVWSIMIFIYLLD